MKSEICIAKKSMTT